MVKQYLDHSREILTSPRSDFKMGSKGMGLISLFGYQNEYDLREGFPILTTKKTFMRGITHELIWFMRGESNIKYLVDNGVHIWDDNAFDHNLPRLVDEGIFPESVRERYSPDWQRAKMDYVGLIKEDDVFAERWGDVGPLYGKQWRHWTYVDGDGKVQELDQLGAMIETLRKKPTSKRNVMTAWNPGDNRRVSQPSCHIFLQATANEEGQMDLQLYQRSCDMFLGVPFNIASYAMFAQVLAQEAGLEPRTFVHTFGDSHFYAGDGERAEWYRDNLPILKGEVSRAIDPEHYAILLPELNSMLPPERDETKGQDHVTAILEQMSRRPRSLPTLTIADKHYSELTIDDFVLKGYDPHPAIRRAMAV
jgi:thymidylate synthase